MKSWIIISLLTLFVMSVGQYAEAPKNSEGSVRIIGQPTWWIGDEGQDNASNPDGPVYFAATVENLSSNRSLVTINFRAYWADGSYFETCDYGETVVDVLAGEKALAYCQPSRIKRTTKGLQIVARIISAESTPYSEQREKIENISLIKKDVSNGRSYWTMAAQVSNGDAAKEQSAKIGENEKGKVMYTWKNSAGNPCYGENPPDGIVSKKVILKVGSDNLDVEKIYQFRAYDLNDVQIAVVDAGKYLLQPEVKQKIAEETSFDLAGPQPVRIKLTEK